MMSRLAYDALLEAAEDERVAEDLAVRALMAPLSFEAAVLQFRISQISQPPDEWDLWTYVREHAPDRARDI